MPIVSIVIPHFDRSELLRQSIQSVIAQRYAEWEVIVVDDGSKDSEWNAIQTAANDKVHLLKRADGPKGPSRCRNLGAAAAQGDYLLFLDSDDLLAEFCLEQRLAHAERQPDGDLWVFPAELFRIQVGDLRRPWNRLDPTGDDLARFLSGDGPWCVSSPLWRRSAFFEVGGFNEQLGYGDDAELHVRAITGGAKIYQNPGAAPDVFVRRSDISRITNSSGPELLDSRRVHLEQVTAGLRKDRVEGQYQAIWEGQYFVECEFLLFNQDSPHAAIHRVIERWEELYSPGSLRSWLVKSYFGLSTYFLARGYLLVRICRRFAMLVLPADYFPQKRFTR